MAPRGAARFDLGALLWPVPMFWERAWRCGSSRGAAVAFLLGKLVGFAQEFVVGHRGREAVTLGGVVAAAGAELLEEAHGVGVSEFAHQDLDAAAAEFGGVGDGAHRGSSSVSVAGLIART